MKPLAALVALVLSVSLAEAKTQAYVLQPAASTVGFETDFGPDKITGRMPVSQADLNLDFRPSPIPPSP